MHQFAETPAKLWDFVANVGYQALKTHRKAYKVMFDEYVGGSTGFAITGKRITNYVYETVEGVMPSACPERIRHKITQKMEPQKFDALKLSLAADHDAKEMDLPSTYSDAALEAMFAPITVLRVAQQFGPRTVEIDGEELAKPRSIVDLVQFEDLSIDCEANHWNRKRFIADRVEISRSKAIESRTFGRDPEDYMQPMPNGQMPEGAPEGIEVMTREEAVAWLSQATDKHAYKSTANDRKVQGMGAKGVAAQDPDKDQLLLWHVAIYHGDCVYIAYIPDTDSQPDKFLVFEKYKHHPKGPYAHVTFGDVRGNILGVPGLASIMDLHDAGRRISSKAVKEMLKMQSTLVYSEDASDDAMRVWKNQGDGPVRVRDVSKLTTMVWGGVPKEYYDGMSFLDDRFSHTGSNVRLTSGSAPDSKTASQDIQKQGNAARRMSLIPKRMRGLMRTVAEMLIYQSIFNNPVGERTVAVPAPDGTTVPVNVNPAEMQADALSFQYDIEPFDYAGTDPLTERNSILQFLEFYMDKLLPGVLQGALKPEAVAEIGRVNFGIDNIEDLIGNLPSLVQAAAQQMQAAQVPVGAPQGSPTDNMKPAQPGGGYQRPVNAMAAQLPGMQMAGA